MTAAFTATIIELFLHVKVITNSYSTTKNKWDFNNPRTNI